MTVPHPNFIAQYPRSAGPAAHGGLNLAPVSTKPTKAPANQLPVEHAGFSADDVQTALGNTRFNNLMAAIVTAGYSGAVFSCGHKTVGGVEVHCIYASDLEHFLALGG